MKFKVGDKVKFNVDNQCFATEFGFDSKGVYEVQNVFGTIQLKNDSGAYHAFNFDRLELAEPKKSKNQRIAELENEVAENKADIQGINLRLERIGANSTKRFREFTNDITEIERKMAGYKDGYLQDCRKMLDMIQTLSKKVESLEFVLAEKSKITGIKPSMVVFDEIVPKSPNQQRAEIIEKAKKFVDEHKNNHKFVVQDNLVVAFNSKYDGKKQGYACCNPSDVFNEHIGKAIALGRALGLDVSEFEQAVQPTVAVGQIIEALDHDTGEIVITYEVDRISGEGYPVKKNGGLASKYRIINDTNTIYEEENK